MSVHLKRLSLVFQGTKPVCGLPNWLVSLSLFAKGLNVPEIPKRLHKLWKDDSDTLLLEAPSLGYKKSYERFSNNLGWKTKAQVFGRNEGINRNGDTFNVISSTGS